MWGQWICCGHVGSVDLLWSCGVSGFVVVMWGQWICCGHVGSVDLLWQCGSMWIRCGRIEAWGSLRSWGGKLFSVVIFSRPFLFVLNISPN